MAEPDNHTLRLLREIREQIGRLEYKIDETANTLTRKIDSNHAEVADRLDRLRQAMVGESVLGRYAAGEVDERLDALEKRVAALEERR